MQFHLILQRLAPVSAIAAVLAGLVLAQPVAAASYDDCAVRVLAGRTYVFVSLDNPSPAGDNMLWATCSEMVESGYATTISTRTPMAGAGNSLVCSSDIGPAHMHVWAAPDGFSTSVASAICEQMPVETVTWWPLA
jgi:hypothetical protein